MKKAALFFFFIHFFIQFCAFLEATQRHDGKSRTEKEKRRKPSRRRSEQFAHDNMCDYLHHNGSHRWSEVSLVSSSHVSEQLMCGARCNRSSCPGRTGAWPRGSSLAWHGDVLCSPAKKMEKLNVWNGTSQILQGTFFFLAGGVFQSDSLIVD